MRLHLVRHGHTEALGRTLTGRSPGVRLSELGREQASRVALGLSGEPIARVFSSPRLRTRQTAERIADAAGCIVDIEDRLDEIDFGAWSGRDFSDLDGDEAWSAWNATRSLAATPGGETMLQAQARAVGFVQQLRDRRSDASFVLVSHADVIKSVLAYLLGMPIDLMQRIEISPAGRSEVVFEGGDVRVLGVNVRPGALPHAR